MSDFATEYTRVKNNFASAYTKCQQMGATMPQTQNSSNLASTVNSISSSGLAINGKIENYLIANGQTIVRGNFVRYVSNSGLYVVTSNSQTIKGIANQEGIGGDTIQVIVPDI